MSEHEDDGLDLSRREFLAGTGALVVATAVAPVEAQQATSAPAIAVDAAVPHTTIRLTVNGVSSSVDVEDRWTLVELLRDRLGLTGTKVGCDRGECGACTVLVDDTPVYACSQLAVWMDGRRVTTVEGLATNGRLTPLQQAFVDHDAPQCGFCTSGQLMSATALLRRIPQPNAEQVKSALAGNICRCGNYNHYVAAVLAAAGGSTTRPSGGGGDQ
jgi:aerobic-type carbon monoxide dehydrogenase small subunit (CoxS/CutS family)